MSNQNLNTHVYLMFLNLEDREKHNLYNIYYFLKDVGKSGYGDDMSIELKKIILYIYTEQSEAQKMCIISIC